MLVSISIKSMGQEMNNLFELREREIFKTLSELRKFEFAVIGGYAVNAYAIPRFSVDCDLVVSDSLQAEKIKDKLEILGYQQEEKTRINTPYHEKFLRYEKKIEEGFKVNMDILIGKIADRQSGAVIDASWVFAHSSFLLLKGKTFSESITLQIPSVEALIIMKMLSCRETDMRDIFMMILEVKDFLFIEKEIAGRTDFSGRLARLKKKVSSPQFKDNLQGVYGFFPEAAFQKHLDNIMRWNPQKA